VIDVIRAAAKAVGESG